MKTRTFALAAALAALVACTEDGPDVAAVPDAVPGDPAVYAPDGWPIKTGEAFSGERWRQLRKDFPSYTGITGMHLVGDRVYGAQFTRTRVMGALTYRYEGHFPAKARWEPERDRAENESRWLPERFRGRIEYEPPQQHVGFDENGEPYLIPELLSPMHAEREERRKQREEERRKR